MTEVFPEKMFALEELLDSDKWSLERLDEINKDLDLPVPEFETITLENGKRNGLQDLNGLHDFVAKAEMKGR